MILSDHESNFVLCKLHRLFVSKYHPLPSPIWGFVVTIFQLQNPTLSYTGRGAFYL